MAASTAAVAPGLKLPKRLIDFFARYPPEHYSAKVTGTTLPLTRREAREAAIASRVNTSPAAPVQPEHAAAEINTSGPASISIPTPAPPSTQSKFPPNPFLPRKNYETGRWAGARIGLRRQAELVKMAKKYKIEELLPPGRKSTEFKQARLIERGLRVKGTGEGEKVKGHKWERHIGATLDKRRTAMESMPELVQEWKRVSLTFAQYARQERVLTLLSSVAMAEDGRNIPSRPWVWILHKSSAILRDAISWLLPLNRLSLRQLSSESDVSASNMWSSRLRSRVVPAES